MRSQPNYRRIFLCLTAIVTVMVSGLLIQQQQELSAAIPFSEPTDQPPKDTIEDFMASKLAAINAAMESAATDDFSAVEKAGRDLILLSKRVAWTRQSNATYLQDTVDFVQAAEFLIRMAEAEDSQGVAYSYGAVAACCLNCHRHVRTPKIAVLNSPRPRTLAMVVPCSQ